MYISLFSGFFSEAEHLHTSWLIHHINKFSTRKFRKR